MFNNHAVKSKDPSRNSWLRIIPRDKITNNQKEVLGDGSTAKVYKEYLEDGSEGRAPVAVKVFFMNGNNLVPGDGGGLDFHAALMDQVAQEGQLTNGMSHPNIVHIVGLRLWPLSLVMEFCTNKSLYNFLEENKLTCGEDWAKRIMILIGIADGMDYLHSLSILHQDLKTPNILLLEDCTPRIADFGMAGSKLPPTEEGQLRNPTWMAPEVALEGKDPTTKSDVFSFAIIMWELLTGQKPWGGFMPFQVFVQLEQKQRPTLPENIPANYYGWELFVNLMETCWSEDPSQRPEFAEILRVLRQILKRVQDAEKTDASTASAQELEGANAADPSLGIEDISVEVTGSKPGCLPRSHPHTSSVLTPLSVPLAANTIQEIQEIDSIPFHHASPTD